MPPKREIRASYSAETIRVYQAFAQQIATPAVRSQTFVEPFKRSRMTWVKPSFLWMMYRSGWAHKDGQERVLAIDITRAGFEWALSNSCLTASDSAVHADPLDWLAQLRSSPVRIQWDPERDILLRPLDYRTVQVGLRGPAVDAYVEKWITRIEDLTDLVHRVELLVNRGAIEEAESLVPAERPYPLPQDIALRIGSAAVGAE